MKILKTWTWYEKLAIFLFIALLGFGVVSYYSTREKPVLSDSVASQGTSTVQSEEDLEDGDAKKLELYKRELIAEHKKAEEDASHSAKMKLIEEELEQIRGEQLQIGGNPSLTLPPKPSK